jgi:hypothetical protein
MCWTAQMQTHFTNNLNINLTQGSLVDEKDIKSRLQHVFINRLVNNNGSKTKYYVDKIRNNSVTVKSFETQRYLIQMHKTKKRVALAQFRTGSHWLNIELGRWQGLDREERKCQRCEMGMVDDEEHMVFHCSKFNELREEYQDLFESVDVGDIDKFINNADKTYRIADFIHE